MADDYDDHAVKGDDELSLPKATADKLIKEFLPADVQCLKDARDLITECCVEFVHLIATEANDLCEKDTKKTIRGEHIIAALERLGFNGMLDEMKNELEEVRRQTKEEKVHNKRKGNKLLNSGRTQEDLLAEQQKLFEAAKARQLGRQSPISGPASANSS